MGTMSQDVSDSSTACSFELAFILSEKAPLVIRGLVDLLLHRTGSRGGCLAPHLLRSASADVVGAAVGPSASSLSGFSHGVMAPALPAGEILGVPGPGWHPECHSPSRAGGVEADANCASWSPFLENPPDKSGTPRDSGAEARSSFQAPDGQWIYKESGFTSSFASATNDTDPVTARSASDSLSRVLRGKAVSTE